MTRLGALAAIILVSLPVFSLDPQSAAGEYARLQKWRVSQPLPLPENGFTITVDTATWVLQSGSIRLLEPATDGTVTGLVFEGSGRFRMTVPDRYELAQLRRFAGKQGLTEIDQPITQLVLRTSDATLLPANLPPAGAGYSAMSLIEKRHEHWFEHLHFDADAAIVAALLNPGMLEVIVDAKTADFDWLLYEFDSWRPEEITLSKYRNGRYEQWVSLDRPGQRRPDGRPVIAPDPAALAHVDVKADLTKQGSGGTVGMHNQRTLDGRYVVDATYVAGALSLGALRLTLHPAARELTASDPEGAPLDVLRDPIGRRSMAVDNKYHDDDFVVILPEPMAPGAKRTIRFTYRWESANYAPGGGWYPTVSDTLLQPHTSRLELTTQKRNEARATGRLESRVDGERSTTTVWVVEKPTKMVTFSTATRFEEVRLDPGGIPPVIAFGPDYQRDNFNKVRNVGADVANSMQFFQQLLGDPLDVPEVYVTSIAAGHGQAFEGFIHMGEGTFSAEHPGASELFRAHEVAHAWFGHKIGWASYRDQWLSEAFAEYAAMMFVQGFVKGGPKYFDEILKSYDGIVKGLPLAGGFSKFNRPWLAEMNRFPAERIRVGPIGHGWRASTSDVPGYLVQSYYKGPLVIHMLRTILGMKTGSDELFITVLRDYVKRASGKSPQTDDLRKILELHVGPGWEGFFDSWIYGADIPSYTWGYDVQPGEKGQKLTLRLQRRDTAPDFMTIIPVRIEFDGGRAAYVFVMNREDRQTVSWDLAEKPKRVVFAPDHSLLAFVKKE